MVVNSIASWTVHRSSDNVMSYLLQTHTLHYVTRAVAKAVTLPPTGLTIFRAYATGKPLLTPQPRNFTFNFTLNISLAQLAVHISLVSAVKSFWSLKVFILLSS